MEGKICCYCFHKGTESDPVEYDGHKARCINRQSCVMRQVDQHRNLTPEALKKICEITL